ncbi:TetR/AcrR family transcriptional regulator [Methylobacterium sp. J-076]|uniref:TetR/AcrR family transcriptional regulator n=1 Tax=Methylobacterium sp. J-076 TaxID=2836655 RepID=UPI001FBBB07F|nr:TetR/AcrR family transcriptional regulator [Methylobacterium sp. J-076]MCJ2014052.1 TetR/AcrR family transcriptional regulator [Methylobacterium sp. J-076]
MPRGQRRRCQILAVAERILLRHGLAETTMQRVAEEAGASKETLYRHFRSKDDLLIEIVLARTAKLRAALDANFESGENTATVLRDLGRNLLQAMGGPEVIPLLRIVVTETVRNPDLGMSLFTAGPDRTHRLLTAHLEAAKRRGTFRGEDPALAASLYIGSVLGNAMLLNLLRPPERPLSAGDIDARVEEAVALFLARYG